MTTFYDRFTKITAPADTGNVVPLRPAGDGIHPYAAAAIAAELDRLNQLPRPWHEGANWDTTTFEVACNLLELANSPWSGYTRTQAEADHRAHAPTDNSWGHREIEQKWRSAEQRIGTTGRPDPGPAHEPAEVPAVTTIDFTPQPGEDPGAAIERLFPLLDWHDLFNSEHEEEWILEPLLPARRLVALYSAPKVGKSLLMLELAVAVARGTEALGTIPDRPRRVLYVDFENDPRGDIRTRLEAMNVGPDDLDDLCYLSFPTIAKLDTEMGAVQLLAAIQYYACEVVVIDTVSRAIGGEENANDTWLAFYRHTGLAMKQAGVACIRLDHSGKDKEKGMRGGSAKYGDVDAVWRLNAVADDTVQLECTDHRMTISEKAITLTRETTPLRHRVAGNAWAAAAEARETAIDRRLDELGVPANASVRVAAQALRDAGEKVTQRVIEAAVRARKIRFNLPVETDELPVENRHRDTSVTVRDGGQVGVTGAPYVVGPVTPTDPVSPAPRDTDELVSCTNCFRATPNSHTLDGLCPTCTRENGVTQ